MRRSILQHRSCRLILATPACFAKGFLPSTAGLSHSGVNVSVQGVANHRYQVVSGWDYVLRKPKPSRRLVPAGGVYFVRLEGSDTAIEKWMDMLWLQSISDDDQDRRDGFGIVVLGAWDGKLKEWKLTEATA